MHGPWRMFLSNHRVSRKEERAGHLEAAADGLTVLMVRSRTTPLYKTVPPIIRNADYTGGAAIPKEREAGEPSSHHCIHTPLRPWLIGVRYPERDNVGLSPVNTVHHFVQATPPNTPEVHRK